ncbi:MAG TPA: hypothetical protein VJ305_19835 [Streptosporangiaceae bacterium]|nr:hypothetical protein [Streptosporangiaceae bacterium]
MARLPNRVQNQPFGSQNNAGKNRQAPQPTLLVSGPAQGHEQAIDPKIPEPVLRQLNTLQDNIRAATSQIKANPTGNSQLLQGITLENGAAMGATPYTTLNHGLQAMATSIVVHGVYGGTIDKGPVIISKSNTSVEIWTQVTAFPGQNVTADILVYA